jgi:4-hydroxythreonine-4-phosphate dehydrogenase
MNSAARIVMIADDLSGAADCAVTCAVQGLSTVVQLSETSEPESAQVIAIDAATRSMPADRAAATVGRIAAAHPPAEDRVLFKKLDSLLRGHIGPELAAIRRGLDSVVVMAAALPSQGRTSIDGCQRMHGERLANADALRLLELAGLTCACIDLSLVRGGSQNLTAKMAGLARNQDVLVCDAETDADLQAIAAAAAGLPRAIWAGSAGLARYIPEAMGFATTRAPVEDPHFRGPILLAVGSRSPLAHDQASEAGRLSGMTTVLLAPETLRGGCDSLGHALDSGKDVAVVIDSTGEITEDPALCAALASWIRPHIKKAGALIVTGGETARAVLMASDITGLRLLREVEAGVPLAVSLGAIQIPVITKSGSFGGRDTLAHCVRTLRGLKLE